MQYKKLAYNITMFGSPWTSTKYLCYLKEALLYPDVPGEHNTAKIRLWIWVSSQCDHWHSHVDHKVENSEEGEGEDVHEDQVEPGHVHLPDDNLDLDGEELKLKYGTQIR